MSKLTAIEANAGHMAMMYEFNLNPFQSYIFPHAIRDVPLSTLLMIPTYEKKESSLMYLSPKDFPYVRKNVALILSKMSSLLERRGSALGFPTLGNPRDFGNF